MAIKKVGSVNPINIIKFYIYVCCNENCNYKEQCSEKLDKEICPECGEKLKIKND